MQGKASDNSAGGVKAWLVDYVSRLTSLEPKDIDVNEPLVSYGLGSIHAVQVSGDLEQQLHIQLSPTLMYEHPTIESIVAHINGQHLSGHAPGTQQKTLEQRLQQFAPMSDEEAIAALRADTDE